jgi:hypothetical protein
MCQIRTELLLLYQMQVSIEEDIPQIVPLSEQQVFKHLSL